MSVHLLPHINVISINISKIKYFTYYLGCIFGDIEIEIEILYLAN